MKLLYNVTIITLLSISSCNKDEVKKNTYNYHGYIYSAVDSTPYRNTSFKFYQVVRAPSTAGGKTQEEVMISATDSSGYFNIDFNVIKTASGSIFICQPEFSNNSCENNGAGFGIGKSGDVGTIYLR